MTATTLLDRVPVGEISERAREVKFGRTLLTLLAGLIFGAAWVTAKAFTVTWLGVSWCATASRLGWKQARGNQPSRATLREENDRLRQEIARLGA